ncbi:hypothetical protein LCGC14_1356670 [marine sediment metagenome]|uniref:Uncharacterized protein n=1 Tax=marine sediment metagenome TaxID=412755 RepID=A0A0F9KA10_9ZZZZ
MEAESVTTCAGCGSHRLCRDYKGVWICYSGKYKCWRYRKDVYAQYQDKEGKRDDCFEVPKL